MVNSWFWMAETFQNLLWKYSGKLFVTYTMVLMIYVMFSTKIPLVPVKNTAVMANSCLGNNKLFFIQIVHE